MVRAVVQIERYMKQLDVQYNMAAKTPPTTMCHHQKVSKQFNKNVPDNTPCKLTTQKIPTIMTEMTMYNVPTAHGGVP